jgi:hypothetical protein
MHALLALAGLGLLGVAVTLGRRSVDWLDRYRLLAETPSVDAADVTARDRDALSGVARGDSTFWSPVERRECLLAAWRIDRYSEHKDRWETLATGAHAAPFELADGTGSVRVDLRARDADDEPRVEGSWLEGAAGPVDDEAFTRFAGMERVTRHPPDEMPDHLARLTRRADAPFPEKRALGALDLVTEHDERRYFETVVTPGDDVFVLGSARPDPDASSPLGPADLAVRPPAAGGLVVSNRPAEAVRASVRNRMLLVPVALLLGVVGLATLPGAFVLSEFQATMAVIPIAPVTLVLGAVLLAD